MPTRQSHGLARPQAASTAAFKTRMLVWKATPSITRMVSLNFLLDAVTACMVITP